MTVILKRKTFDGNIETLSQVDITQLGELNIVIGFNEVNEPVIESADISPSRDFVEIVKEAHLTLKEAHEAMFRAQYAFNHAATDMFAIKKYIDGAS